MRPARRSHLMSSGVRAGGDGSGSATGVGLGMASLADVSAICAQIAGQWVYGWRGRVVAPQLGPVLRRPQPVVVRRRSVTMGQQRVRLGVARFLPGMGQRVARLPGLGQRVARRLPGRGRQRVVARHPPSLARASGQPRIDGSRQPQKPRSVLRRQSVSVVRTGGTTRSCMRSSDQRAKLRRLTQPDILVSATTRRAPGAGSTR